jgi:CubicO group peptidase (beta-lactamase class C family)
LKALTRLILVPGLTLLAACWPSDCRPVGAQAPPGVARRPRIAPGGAAVRKDSPLRLARIVPRLMREGDVPGLSLALIRDARVVWHRGFGVRNAATKEPVGDGTIFEAASLSKPVFAYAVLKLVDGGKLALDRPLSEYAPEAYAGGDRRAALITARMVLEHTTGFQNEVTPGSPLKIYFTPGERFSYSGEGFLYLQRVVEHITGEPLDEFMRKAVFEPLGMTSSSFVWQERFGALKAYGHKASGDVVQWRRPVAARAASGLHTTALDYAKFVIAVLNGTGLRRETAGQMLEGRVLVDEGCTSCVERSPGRLSRTLSWGLGWGVERTEAGDAIWHWGDNNGEFHNFVIAYPREGAGVVIFTNSGNGLSIIPEIVSQAIGGGHPAFAWMGYEAYNSPGRILFREILARGSAAISRYRDSRKKGQGSGPLNEAQVNNLGYWLLGKKRVAEAVEVFKMNVEDFPGSWNAYDSLAEAYMVSGDKELAVINYRRSLELNPGNVNAVEMLKRLQDR